MVNVRNMPTRFHGGAPKPRLSIKLGTYLPPGFGDCFDANGRLIAQVPVPSGRIPEGTREMALSYEDYFAATRAMGGR